MRPRRRPAVRGVTLIELLIVVAIVALLLTLVAPSFKRMIEVQRLRGINAQLVTDLQFARSEAVTRNAYMRVTLGEDATTSCYTIYTYTSNATRCDCTQPTPCTAAGQVEVRTVRIPKSGGVTVKRDVGMPIEFAFEPIAGALYKIPTDFLTRPLTRYDITATIDTERTLRTTVGLGGRPTVCAPTGSKMQVTAC